MTFFVIYSFYVYTVLCDIAYTLTYRAHLKARSILQGYNNIVGHELRINMTYWFYVLLFMWYIVYTHVSSSSSGSAHPPQPQ